MIEMSSESGVDSNGEATGVGRDRISLRRRMERFARLRSAQRALPTAAVDLQESEDREDRANFLRLDLKRLAEAEGTSQELTSQLSEAQDVLDAKLDEMEGEVRTQFDLVEFASLRATIPRSVETHRHEVLALLETLLEDRDRLLDRLPKVEYLITMLSTEEVEQRRNIVHDPVALTPLLTNFEEGDMDPVEADSIAAELYQVASLDADRENPLTILRSVRSRKESIGLGCLSPMVLRAVVTYNARMFNCVESVRDTSRASDEILEELLGISSGPEIESERGNYAGGLDESDEIWANIGGAEKPTSVFDSQPLASVMDALCRRQRGVPIGSCASERVALVLDISSLDPIELVALMAEERDDLQELLARTTVVGLVLRDLGAVQVHLVELGLPESDLTSSWVQELNSLLGQKIAERIKDADQYELTSTLSGIKAKYLLAPMSALNAAKGRAVAGDVVGADDAAEEMRQVSREALLDSATGATSSVREASGGIPQAAEPSTSRWRNRQRMTLIAAAVPLFVMLGLMTSNFILAEKPTVETITVNGLGKLSPFISSAYRSEHGKGNLLIGRVDKQFAGLSKTERYAETEEMRARCQELGIRDAMIYDESGRLKIHIASNRIRLPHAPPKLKKKPAPGGLDRWF
jgi:hypothetical protein